MAALRGARAAALPLALSLLWSVSGAEDRLAAIVASASNTTEDIEAGLRQMEEQVRLVFGDEESRSGLPRRLNTGAGPPECQDPYPGWRDRQNRPCWYYDIFGWCVRTGGIGPKWPWTTLGLDLLGTDGVTAEKACCACGACPSCRGCADPLPLHNPWDFEDFESFNCTHVNGSLTIRPMDADDMKKLAKLESVSADFTIGGRPITLQALSSLKWIGGSFYLYAPDPPSSFRGLESLTRVGLDFNVLSCYSCTDMQGLESLESIGRDLFLQASTFDSLRGFTSLRSIRHSIIIVGVRNLRTLRGLGNVTGGLSGMIFIDRNPSLETLDGLEGITSVGSRYLSRVVRSLYIYWNRSLRSIDGLRNIRGFVRDEVTVKKLYILTSLAPLAGITVFGSNVELDYLPLVRSLHGLHNVQGIGGNLTINNVSITTLAGLDSLYVIQGALWIKECHNLHSLQGLEALRHVWRSANGSSIMLYKLDALESIASLAGLSGPLAGSLSIDVATALKDLHGLEGVTSLGMDYIGYSLHLRNVRNLGNLDGLCGLRGRLPGALAVRYSLHLQTIEGLRNVTAARGLYLTGTQLQTLEGLNSLTSLDGGDLVLTDHPRLRSIEALGNLSGILKSAIVLERMPTLESVLPLRGITKIGNGIHEGRGWLTITGLRSLRDLSGLSGLQDFVTDQILTIGDNANLRSLQGLEGLKVVGGLYIHSCPELKSLAALGSLTRVISSINILNMPRIESLHGLDGIVSIGLPIQCACIGASCPSASGSLVGTFLYIDNCPRLRSIAALGSMSGGVLAVHIGQGALESLEGLEQILARTLSLFTGPRLCIPEAKRSQLEAVPSTWCSASAADKHSGYSRAQQLAATASCMECDPPCGWLPDGRRIECDQRRGECRCPLGTMGPGCLEAAPSLSVVPSQSFECLVSEASDDKMICSLRASLMQTNLDGNSSRPERLAIYKDSKGDGQSEHPQTTAKQGEEYEAVTTGNVTWQNESHGEIEVHVKLRRKSAYDGERTVLHLFVGYHREGMPDSLLGGTLLDGPLTSSSPRTFPWCLELGAGCRLTAPVSFEVGFRMKGGRIHFMRARGEAKEDQEVAVAVLQRVGGDAGMVWAAVEVDAAATTAIPGVDFKFERETIYWADGDTRDRAVLVRLVNNAVWEPSKTLVLTIAEVSHEHQRGATNQLYNMTLLDDGDGGVLRIHSSGSIREDAGNASDCLVKVERSGGKSGSTSVQVVLEPTPQLCGVSADAVAVADSPAVAYGAADFSFAPGRRLTWADGEDAEKCVFSRAGGARLAVYGDWATEENEALCLRLADPAGTASVASSAANALVTIIDRGTGGDKGSYLTCDRGTCSCAPGWYANGSAGTDECWKCELGHFCEGGWLRAPCRPGSFAASGGATACDGCAQGMYQERSGRSSCGACPKGSFSNSSGSSTCTSCSSVWGLQGFSTVGEATSAESCACPTDHYLPCAGRHCPAGAPPPDGGCLKCPKGFSCSGGLELLEAVLQQSARQARLRRLDQLTPQTLVHAEPLLEPGAFASKDLPYCAIMCGAERGDERCPGLRRPGICGGPHRKNVLACGGCESGYYGSGGKCVECDQGFLSVVPIILGLPCALIALCLVAHVVNKQQAKQRHALVAMSATLSIGLFSMQALGSFSKLAIDWIEPAKMLLSTFKDVFNVNDLKILQIECIVGDNSDLAAYLGQLFVTPVVLLLALVAVAVRNCRGTLADFRAEAIQTLGTLVLVFFIIVLGATVQPFVMFNHHCKGRASLRAYPNVFVGSDAHVPLVISGALAAVLIPGLFLTVCIWATWQVSGRTASGDTEFLRSFRFLFGRFHHEAYYYSLVQLTRNTLLSMVPVMMRSPAGGQLLLCMLVITLPMIIQIKVAPWRIHHINYLETICLAGLLQILAFGLLLAQAPTDTRALQRVFLAVFLGLLLVVVAFLLWATVWAIRPRTRFAFFVCHAKGDAGTRARALQLKLEQKSRWPKDTFIDADHLFNLDTLFETVRSDVRNLVVFLSGMTLNRPWCAGEIATAVRNNVPIIVVRASDFMAPDLDGEPEGNAVEARSSGPQRSSMVRSLFSRGSRRSVAATEPQKCPMADFFDYATSGLAQYEITPPDILSAYRKLLEMDCIITRPRLGNTEMEHLADTILSWSKNVQGYKAMPKAVGTVAKKFTGSQAVSAIASRTRSLAISATGSRGTATSMQNMPSGNSLGTASSATATSLSSNQSQRAKIDGTVALLTEAGDAEGAAGAMILFQLLLPFLDDTCFIQVDKGMSPPPLQDLLDYLNTPGSSANACHTAVILLSRSCLTSPETLAVILAAMRRFRNKDLNIVSVALPGFAYPGADFYDIELPARIETLPEHLRGPPDAVKDFFKLISVPLSTHGSRSVLEAQSSEVLLRVKQGAILAKGTKAAAGDEDAGGKVKVSGSAAAYSSEASSSKWGQRSTEGVGSIPVAAEPEEQAVPAAGEQAETSDLVVAVPEDSEGPTKVRL